MVYNKVAIGTLFLKNIYEIYRENRLCGKADNDSPVGIRNSHSSVSRLSSLEQWR